MPAYVYILANTRRGVMYVGVTTRLSARLAQHRTGETPGFAARYGATRLVYVETFTSLIDARASEHRLKRWRRQWKFALIERDNPDWRDLAEVQM